jgi:hypothetical protein
MSMDLTSIKASSQANWIAWINLARSSHFGTEQKIKLVSMTGQAPLNCYPESSREGGRRENLCPPFVLYPSQEGPEELIFEILCSTDSPVCGRADKVPAILVTQMKSTT